MKKLLALVLAACLLMTVVPAFATVADTVAAGENLTHDELVEKAKATPAAFPPPLKTSASSTTSPMSPTTSRTLKSTPSSKAKSRVPPRAPTW